MSVSRNPSGVHKPTQSRDWQNPGFAGPNSGQYSLNGAAGTTETIAPVLAEQTLWPGEVRTTTAPCPVAVSEIEEAFANAIAFQVMAAGEDGQHEGIYLRLGQTRAGRLLAILFAYRGTRNAWILSARDMAIEEHRYYVQYV